MTTVSPTRRSRTTSTSRATAACSARSRRGSRSSSTGGSRWARSAGRSATSTCAPPISVETDGWAHFDYVKMPDYRWGIFLEPKDRRPRARLRRQHGPAGVGRGAGRVPQHAAPADRHAGRHRAGERRAAAPPRRDRAVALRPAQPVPGQRRGGPSPVGDGLPAAHVLRPRRPRRGRGAARSAAAATPTSRASSARSTSRPRTGCRSSCSRCSRIATASISCARSPRAASIRSRARAGSCSPRKRTTCSSARPACSASCKRACELMKRRRRRARAGRHRSADDPEVPEPLVLAVARSVRRRGIVERGRCVRGRPQGSLQGRPLRRAQADRQRRSRWTCCATARSSTRTCRCAPRSTRCCAPSTSRTASAASIAGTRRSRTRASTSSSRCRRTSSTARSACGPRHMLHRPTASSSTSAAWNARRGEWLPTDADEVYIKSLMKPVYEPGKMASWIAPPREGHQQPARRLRVRAALTGDGIPFVNFANVTR